MDIVGGAARVVTRTADATTAAAGAIGGAAITGMIGGVQGTLAGIRNGLSTGSDSTPAAMLTLGAIGAAGLVEWPVLLTVGGTALVVHQLSRRSEGQPAPGALQAVGGTSRPRKSAPRKSSAQRSRPRKASTSRRRSATRTS